MLTLVMMVVMVVIPRIAYLIMVMVKNWKIMCTQLTIWHLLRNFFLELADFVSAMLMTWWHADNHNPGQGVDEDFDVDVDEDVEEVDAEEYADTYNPGQQVDEDAEDADDEEDADKL